MAKLDKLKKRWGLESSTQVIIILIVFAVTGMSVVYVKSFLFEILGFNKIQNTFLYILLYILTILPIYQVLLLIYGFLFGQFRFFWEFEKKMFRRFSFSKSNKS